MTDKIQELSDRMRTVIDTGNDVLESKDVYFTGIEFNDFFIRAREGNFCETRYTCDEILRAYEKTFPDNVRIS